MGSNDKHVAVQYGVWTVVENKSSSFVPEWLLSLHSVAKELWAYIWKYINGPEGPGTSLKHDKTHGTLADRMKNYTCMLSDVVSFVKEVYSLGPFYFFVGIFMTMWGMASGTLGLYFSTRLLSSITKGLESRQFDHYSIVGALTGRIMVSFLSKYLSRIRDDCNASLGERVKYHFLQKTMRKALQLDLLTAQDPEARSKIKGIDGDLTYLQSDAWNAFDGITETISDFLRILSELSLMLSLSRSSSTFALSVAFCFVHPSLSFFKYNVYSKSFVAFCSNAAFARMAALHNLAFDNKFQEDRLCNNLDYYIEREFKKSKDTLGDINTEYVYSQLVRRQPLLPEVLRDLSWDSSLMFFALRMIWDHTSVTMAEFILVQQGSSSVQSSSYRLIWNMERISRHMLTIRNLYSLDQVKNKIKDGETRYPRPSEKSDSGVTIEFRNVSFQYPGTDKSAVTDISFTIKPGQLVVIVGVNGSGKSSTVKLLARLYDPSDGEILLDGLPLASYKLRDIRRAMTILRQDHPALPLSLRENVAVGLPERRMTDEEFEEAIHLGGAEKFMSKLKQGRETVLRPVETSVTGGEPDAELKAVIDDKEIKTDLSGGETQRLSASRTFMKLMGGNIRLLVADEPTSALDPGGEYELFTRLREQCGCKTAIFITHRFGHLTKYADLILCLKDGRLVEQGTHEKLMAMDGEYRRLYNIQAKAFVS